MPFFIKETSLREADSMRFRSQTGRMVDEFVNGLKQQTEPTGQVDAIKDTPLVADEPQPSLVTESTAQSPDQPAVPAPEPLSPSLASEQPSLVTPTGAEQPEPSGLPTLQDLAGQWLPQQPAARQTAPSVGAAPAAGLEGLRQLFAGGPEQQQQQETSWLPTLQDLAGQWMPPKPTPGEAGATGPDGVTRLDPLAPVDGRTPGAPGSQPGGVNIPRTPDGKIDLKRLPEIIQGDPEGFFKTAGIYARIVEQETGIPAALSLAVAANETGYGQQRYMAGSNNFHGIQALPGEEGAVPYRDWRPGAGGQQVFYDAAQRSFGNPLDGFRGFARFLLDNPRYGKALEEYRKTGDVEGLAAGIFEAGYAEDPAYVRKITSIMRGIPEATGVGEVVDTTSGGAVAASRNVNVTGMADGPDWKTRWADGLTPNQIKETAALGMDWDAQIATCGPAAAIALARAKGGNPTFGEVLEIAQATGEWNQDVGMARGTTGQIALLKRLGVDAVSGGLDEQQIARTVMGGSPVIVNAHGGGGHFYVAQDYDPATGRFNWGNSAGILKRAGGRTWFRLDELSALGVGSPSETIYLR